jgi:hypothetical protein
MKPSRVRILLLIGTVAALTVVLVLFGLSKPPPKPQVVNLPDGSTLTVLGVTYGTNHIVGTPIGKMVARMPQPVRRIAERVLGPKATFSRSSTTVEPALKIWLNRETPPGFRPSTNFQGSCTAFVADNSGFASGPDYWFMPDTVWSLYFTAFPRREEFVLIKLARDMGGEHFTEFGTLRVRNPLFAKYPTWTPDPEHATQSSGHLSVELKRLVTGTSGGSTLSTSSDGSTHFILHTNQPGGRNYSVVETKISTGGHTNEQWEVTGVTVSDATGNVVKNSSLSTGGDGSATSFNPSLWPCETAWKLKILYRRKAGFVADELFAFPDIALPKAGITNKVGWSTNVNGCRVTIAEVCVKTPTSPNSWTSRDSSYLKVTHSPLAENMYLDLGEVWFDNERGNYAGWSSSGQERQYWLREIPAEAKTLRVVFAVHQGRALEFIAKPELLKESSAGNRGGHPAEKHPLPGAAVYRSPAPLFHRICRCVRRRFPLQQSRLGL